VEIVIVSEYNPEWAEDFKREEAKISKALNGLILGIEHIGSTSIPGLGAKPTIDIMVGVADLKQIADEQIYKLGLIDYEYVEKSYFPDRRFFRRGEWKAGTHHLHIYEYMSNHWINNILFREYLKNYPDVRTQYINLKKKLENQFKNDRSAYTQGKSEFIKGIIMRARENNELMRLFEGDNHN